MFEAQIDVRSLGSIDVRSLDPLMFGLVYGLVYGPVYGPVDGSLGAHSSTRHFNDFRSQFSLNPRSN